MRFVELIVRTMYALYSYRLSLRLFNGSRSKNQSA